MQAYPGSAPPSDAMASSPRWRCSGSIRRVARGVLGFLASTQATKNIPERDAEVGKILHETRRGEMAALGEIPFGSYYGSVDATPLFIMLADAYYVRTGDLEFITAIWPNIQRALHWIDHYGDPTGTGFVTYDRQSSNGLVHQGWKDSHDAVFHADGTAARGPIALCEVQAYVYNAKERQPTWRVWSELPTRRKDWSPRPTRSGSGSNGISGAKRSKPMRWH